MIDLGTLDALSSSTSFSSLHNFTFTELFSTSELTSSSSTAFSPLLPPLVQMTQVWTVSAEHSQSIHCSMGAYLSGGNARQHHAAPLWQYFLHSWQSRVLLQLWYLLKERKKERSFLSLQVWWVCLCDPHLVNSHFSGILRFIIWLTSSKISSPRKLPSSQMWTWP